MNFDKTAHVQIIEKGKKTPRGGNPFVHLVLIGKDYSQVRHLYLSGDFIDEVTNVRADDWLVVTNVHIGDQVIRCGPTSRIFCKAASTDIGAEAQKIKEDFLNPDMVTIPDIKDSPSKRRISVQGKVTTAGETLVYGESRMRRVTLMDTFDRTIRITVWGDLAAEPIQTDQKVRITCATVEKINNETSLSTSPSTRIEYEEVQEEGVTIFVIAQKEDTVVCDQGKSWIRESGISLETGGQYTCMVKGNKIVDVVFPTNPKQEDSD